MKRLEGPQKRLGKKMEEAEVCVYICMCVCVNINVCIREGLCTCGWVCGLVSNVDAIQGCI